VVGASAGGKNALLSAPREGGKASAGAASATGKFSAVGSADSLTHNVEQPSATAQRLERSAFCKRRQPARHETDFRWPRIGKPGDGMGKMRGRSYLSRVAWRSAVDSVEKSSDACERERLSKATSNMMRAANPKRA
jgi:hypothetical protein